MAPTFLMITPCARYHGALKLAAAPAAPGTPETHREKADDADDADDAGMAMAWLWFRWIPHGL